MERTRNMRIFCTLAGNNNCMLIGESIIQWHTADDKPVGNWSDVLVACKTNDGELNTFFAHWNSNKGIFEDDEYPFIFDNVLYWAYMPKVNKLSVT